MIDVLSNPYQTDCNANGGGIRIILNVREDI